MRLVLKFFVDQNFSEMWPEFFSFCLPLQVVNSCDEFIGRIREKTLAVKAKRILIQVIGQDGSLTCDILQDTQAQR